MDVINREIIEAVLSEVNVIDEGPIKKIRHKYIAHSATIFSHEGVGNLVVALDEIGSALSKLKRATDVIALNVVGASPYSIPSSPDWSHLDKSIIAEQNIPQLRNHWQKLCDQLYG